VAPAERPTRLKVVHDGTGEAFEQPLSWAAGGTAVSTWSIPPAAKLGRYQVVLERERSRDDRANEWTSGDFRVEEFRLPLVEARIAGPKAAVVAPAAVPIDVQLSYLSGGGLAQTAATGSALLKPRSVSPAGYDEFSFSPPRAQKARDPGAEDDTEAQGSGDAGRIVADKVALKTDRNGVAPWKLDALPKITEASEITAEVTFNDPNGEVQTASTRIEVWPSAVVLGLKTGAWAPSRGKVELTVLALDTAGKPLKGQAVDVRGRLAQVISSRKRIVGGFYAYDNRTEMKDLGAVCSGSTDDRGMLLCDAALETAGQVELIARARDGQGHAVEAAASVWVTKQGELWFGQGNDDRIDVLPEKKRYEPGETARLQVRMPFREATALVSVEREGVMELRVVTLRGDDPTIELPIAKTWGPNVYVTVLALRGRIRETPWYSFFTWGWRQPGEWARSFWYEGREYQAPTALVDLSKPAFKLGVAALQVGLAAHELQVEVTADKPQYAVRQKATARIKVSHGGRPFAGAEVAFAAVDESLLALRDNASWDLLRGMIRTRAWGVETSTGQSEIIGRRHYGRKALAAGGGGGRGSTRELFDTLLVWKARVALDARGEATVEVPLNDSLTSFRFVAVADAGTQMFGSGSTSVRVTQDLQALAGLPPFVRGGDTFSAMLTLRNTTAREMKVRATLQGLVATDATAGAETRPLGPVAASAAAASSPALLNTGAASSPSLLKTSAASSAGAEAPRPLAFPPQEVVLAAGAATEIALAGARPRGRRAHRLGSRGRGAAGRRDRRRQRRGGAGARTASGSRRWSAPRCRCACCRRRCSAARRPYALAVAAPADALPEAGVKRGGITVAVQPRLSGALPGIHRFFAKLPVRLPRAAGFEVDRPQRCGHVGRRRRPAADLPRPRRPRRLLSAARRRPGQRQRSALGLRPRRQPRGRLRDPGGAAAGDARRPRRLRRRPDRAQVLVAAARTSTSASSPRSRRCRATAGRSRGCSARSSRRRTSGRRRRSSTGSASAPRPRRAGCGRACRGRTPDPARAPHLRRHDAPLQHRGQRFWWWLMDNADANAARLILAVIDDPGWKDDLPRLVVGSLGPPARRRLADDDANLWGRSLDKFSASSSRSRGGARWAMAVRVAHVRRKHWHCMLAPARQWHWHGTGPAGHGQRHKPGAGPGISAGAGPARHGRAASSPTGRGRWRAPVTLPWPAAAKLSVAQEGAAALAHGAEPAAIPLQGAARRRLHVTRSISAVRAKAAAAGRAATSSASAVEVEAQGDMTWVVLSDPVAGGGDDPRLGLGRDSAPRGAAQSATPTHAAGYEERAFEAYAATTPTCPKGRHVVEYTCASTPGPLRAAADAGRGDVRAGDLRRAAERGHRVGRDPTPLTPPHARRRTPGRSPGRARSPRRGA
jgi:hypothetical protein